MTPHEPENPDSPLSSLPSIPDRELRPDTLMPANLSAVGGTIGEQVDESSLPSPDFASPLNVDNLFRALRYRWPSALIAGLLLGSASAAAVWFLLPPKYTAYVLLHVAATEQSLLPESRLGLESDRFYQNTQVALIKSRPIILAALRKLKNHPLSRELDLFREQSDPAAWLEEELKANILENTELVRVSLTGKDPKEVKVLVNAVTDAYLEQGVNNQRNQKLALLQELDDVQRKSEEKIRSQREELLQLAGTVKSGDPQALTVKQKFALEEYSMAKRELALLQAQLRNAEVTQLIQKANLKPAGEMSIPEGLVEEFLDAETQVKEKIVELNKREDMIAAVKKVLAPGHPSTPARLAVYERERDAAKAELERSRAERRPVVAQHLRQRMRIALETKVAQTEEQQNIWREQEKLMRADVVRLGQEAERIGLIAFRLELKRGEIDQAEAVIKRLREEKERLQVEVQSTKQRVTVLHEAEEPQTRDYKASIRMAVFAGTAALLLGIFGVSYRESRSRRINTTDEVTAHLGMRVIGILPAVQNHASLARPGAIRAQPGRGNVLVESIDGIRAMLLCDRTVASSRLLMVTSARAREGKSTLAAHLALSIARAGLPSLLVDCDLRRPALHQIFGIPAAPGLSDVLRGQIDISEAIRCDPASGLSVLPVGRQPHKAIQILAQDRIRNIFEQLRRNYDFIIVDSAPVLPVGDSLLLGKQMDSVLLSVRPHVSQVPSVFAAYERLRAARIPVLGVVFNGARKHSNAYQYEYFAQSEGLSNEGFDEFKVNPTAS